MAEDIFGFFDSSVNNDAIEKIAQKLPDNCIIVELGTFFGRSAICWADTLRNLNKPCKIYTVDLFHLQNKTLLSNFKRLGSMKDIWTFILGECTHFEMVKRLVEPYPEIELVVADFYAAIPNIKNVDCIYYDGWQNIDISNHLSAWIELLNKEGVFSGQNCQAVGLYDTAESMNMKVVLPEPDSIVFYLEKANK